MIDRTLATPSIIIVKMPENDAKRTCQRLSEKERLEVINKLSKSDLVSIHITQQEINDFISNYNEDNPDNIKAIIEDVEDTLNNNGAADNSNLENDDDDEKIWGQNNKNSEQVLFSRFDTLYENMLALEDQILCKELQDEAGEKYEKITSHISALQQLLQGVTRDVKWWQIGRMRQSTLHDSFTNK
jgi:hypothetical protein